MINAIRQAPNIIGESMYMWRLSDD